MTKISMPQGADGQVFCIGLSPEFQQDFGPEKPGQIVVEDRVKDKRVGGSSRERRASESALCLLHGFMSFDHANNQNRQLA
jgi:hypothetical protein